MVDFMNCGNCTAFLRQGGPMGVCRARPPVPIFCGVRQTPAVLGMPAQQEPHIVSYFPPMSETGWCRCHEPDFLTQRGTAS